MEMKLKFYETLLAPLRARTIIEFYINKMSRSLSEKELKESDTAIIKRLLSNKLQEDKIIFDNQIIYKEYQAEIILEMMKYYNGDINKISSICNLGKTVYATCSHYIHEQQEIVRANINENELDKLNEGERVIIKAIENIIIKEDYTNYPSRHLKRKNSNHKIS
jgi:hypothetical protein